MSNVYASDEQPGVMSSSFDKEDRYCVTCTKTSKLAKGPGIFWPRNNYGSYNYYTNGAVTYWVDMRERNRTGIVKKDFFDVYVGSPYCYGLPDQWDRP